LPLTWPTTLMPKLRAAPTVM